MKVCIPAEVTCGGLRLGAVVDDLTPVSVGLQIPAIAAGDTPAGATLTVRFTPWGKGEPLEFTGIVAATRTVVKVKDQTYPRLVVSMQEIGPAASAELARFLKV
jgi:hypothetical protein